ncbi:DNA alkylation repair protein [Candidatus Woesearchaeota archaeon]|nr:DNA alkylation repair protein [Candidatus Woesearchaeota archaeon]
MNRIIESIRKELTASVDEKTKVSFQRFFKENVKCYGVKTGTVGKIAKKYWPDVKKLDKREIFELCEKLYQSNYTEEAFIVSFWGANFKSFVIEEDLKTFEGWIKKYIDNWAKCDGFCNHTVGDFMSKYPARISELKRWAKSSSRWMRRAAAVSLIVPAKKGDFLKEAFEISDILLKDKDDMVQKGYGWLLKEESRTKTKEVFDYVMKNKKEMPRTALRYAIELMPKNLKAKAMEK